MLMSRKLAVTGATLVLVVGCGDGNGNGDGNGGSVGSICDLSSSAISDYCAEVARAQSQIQESQALIERFRAQQQQAPPGEIGSLTATQLSQYRQQYPGASVTDLVAAQQEVQRQKDAEIQRQAANNAAWAQYWASRAQSTARMTEELRAQRERDAQFQREYEEKAAQKQLETEQRAAALVRDREHEYNYYQDQASKDRLNAARRAELNP
jgi:hypothetical protein